MKAGSGNETMVELVYKFDEKSIPRVFEKVNPPLKCHSMFFGDHIIYLYIHRLSDFPFYNLSISV